MDTTANDGSPVRETPWPRWPTFGEAEKEAVAGVLDSGWVVAHHDPEGPGEVEAFEEQFADWIGAEHAMGVGNGTEGLQLALAAAGVGVGDEVIVPTFTFLSTATAVLMQNAVPVFADSESETFGLDPADVEEKVTDRTEAIVPVHVCGYPARMAELVAVAEEYDLTVVEDCSHAHGATYGGDPVGTLGDIGVFSLQQKKNLPVGDGGMVVTGREEYAEAIRSLRNFGFGRGRLGYNFRMTEPAAAIGQVRLERLDEQNERRRDNAAFVRDALDDVEGIRVREPLPDAEAVYYSLLFEYDPEAIGLPVGEFAAAVRAEGIPLSETYTPVHRDSTFDPDGSYARGCPWEWALYDAPPAQRPDYADGVCPTAERYMDDRLLELKIHPPVGEADLRQAVRAIRLAVENGGERT